MFNIQTSKIKANSVVKRWATNVINAGGKFERNSLFVANGFMSAISRKSYYKKIKYLLPMLGKGINAARVPLIDVLNVGAATNNNFVDADFNQIKGLQGNGSNKWLQIPITPSQVGSITGGLGYWENNINFSGSDSVPIGVYNTSNPFNRWMLDLRPANSRFTWGNALTSSALDSTSAINGHYYGQNISTSSRNLYLNGNLTANNSNLDTTPVETVETFGLMGTPSPFPGNWAGRCAVVYITDGTLSDVEILDFHKIINNYLMIPSGKFLSGSLIGNLVSYWKFDESSGNAIDSVGGNTFVNNNSASYGTGIINNGINLSASSSQYMSVSNGSQVGLNFTSSFSMSFWVKMASQPGSAYMFLTKYDYNSGNQRAYQPYYVNDGGMKIKLAISSNGEGGGIFEGYASFDYTLTNGIWYHLVYVYDAPSGACTLYVNGVSQGTVAGLPTSIYASSADIRLGANYDGLYLDGEIDETGVWSRMLTPDEVSILYNSGLGNSYPFN